MRRRVLYIVALCLAIGLVAILIARREPSATTVRLTNSREWRILKVSVGTNHILSAEPLWKKALRTLLPEAWQRPLGPFAGDRFQTRYETLTLWVEEVNSATGRRN